MKNPNPAPNYPDTGSLPSRSPACERRADRHDQNVGGVPSPRVGSKRGEATPPTVISGRPTGVRHWRGLLASALTLLAGVTVAFGAAAAPAADRASVTSTLTPEGGRITVTAQGTPAPVPVFFSATVDTVVHLGADEVTGELKLTLHVVQGRPETFSLGLVGDGEVADVTGPGLRDWSVRRAANGRQFLDLRPVNPPSGGGPVELLFTVRTRLAKPVVPGRFAVLLLAPGDAVGFASKLTLQADASMDAKVTQAGGMLPLGGEATALQYYATGESRVEVALARRGAAAAEAELRGAQLAGKVDEASGSVDFRLRGQVGVQQAGARLRLLTGRAALSDQAAGDGWHAELVRDGGNLAYDLVFDRAGVVPVDVAFAAGVQENGDWRILDFQMPAGAVVPMLLDGFGGDGVEFNATASVVPGAVAAGWQGFLPGDGHATVAWKHTRKAAEGTLFFTSFEQTDVRVGAGLLRQASLLTFRILQGKLPEVRLALDGPGEIIGVEGATVTGWSVLPGDQSRLLVVRLSRPIEGEGALVVRSQAELGNFPVQATPLRLTPEGAVRHSGYVRVANTGAVRLELAGTEGMMQLAPEQFPGAPVEDGARQVFVYRFPSASYHYEVAASQILPEVGVAQIVTYTLGETDRVIEADVELDVREAPLHDWTLEIPEDYAVVTVAGSGVADSAAETQVKDGRRALKIVFGQAVQGRVLLQLRLEKNQAAAAGDWRLPPLVFPGAKSVRGHVGVVSTPGFRIVPALTGVPAAADVRNLVEVPLSYFPKQTPGLQQAWRLRDADWAVALRVEARGQSVQADVFHLYSLKEGVVYGSVLFNYFVIGAPASEWRIEVPAGAGNIDVTGQNVQRDWRREGNEIVVTLHQPVLGAATLLVTFEEPMPAVGGTIRPGEVRPVGVQGERGFVQVVSPLLVNYQIARAEGLLKLEPLELPTEFRLLTTAPSLAAYQYTGRPFALEMKVNWYQQAETVDQVVDFAKLSSQISRDGQVVTSAQFFVKTRGRQALRLALPTGVKLWEARVDGETVNARADGGQTLIPLAARLNPNEPVQVDLRLGQAEADGGGHLSLQAPVLQVPLVISDWTLHSDPGWLLVPRGGSAVLTAPALTQSGFEWLSGRDGWAVAAWLLAALLAGLLLRAEDGLRLSAGLVCGILAVWLAALLAGQAQVQRRVNLQELAFSTSVVPAGEPVTIQVDNMVWWHAMVSWWGVAAALAGAVLLGGALLRSAFGSGRPLLLPAAGAGLLSLGLLAQKGGAILFFWTAAAAGLGLLFAGCVRAFGYWRRRGSGGPEAGGAGVATVVSALMLAVGLGFAPGTAPVARAGSDPVLAEGVKAAQSLVQTWQIHDDRLFAEVELTVRGGPGDSFLLLNPPAVLTGFQGEGLRVSKVERDGRTVYLVAPEKDGTFTARAKFEMPVASLTAGLPLPTGPAAMQRVTVELDQGGWEFTSPMAVRVLPRPDLPADRSGATLVLGPAGAPVISLQPKRRDIAAEKTQFSAEAANLFLPGPGVVNGFTRVTVQPMQGRVAELDLDVPAGFTVGAVGNGPIGEWRFDPVAHRLHVAVAPAQTAGFRFDIETQLGTAALPVDLALRPLRVTGAANEGGMIALAFGGDAQPEGVTARGLSPVNTGDFAADLLPHTKDGQPLAVLAAVFRYGQAGGEVDLKAVPVAPEVRVATKQVLSLGDDRLVLAVDLNVAITRVGLFKLSFVLPEGLGVEALSGPALSHWTEATEDGQRVVALHLNGRTIGDQAFALTLAGPAPAPQAAWSVPRLLLREATRQTGELVLVPEPGLRLRAADRTNVSQLDPRAAGDARPGSLAFRLLQADWSLAVGLEALEPWVTVQALQEVTVREGQTLTRLALRYRVENAAVKQLRVRLPGLGDDQVRTVHATGSAVSDFVRVAGEPDAWELHFQRGIAGETDVQIEFQGQPADAQGRETVLTPVFPGVRQVTHFVAVRASGRIELEAGRLPRGWQRADWSAVPANLQDRGDRSVPALAFKVAEPEGPLPLTVLRHEVADALKLRVTAGRLTTVFSPGGSFLTAVELTVAVVEKTTLRVGLPAGARLFNALVNGESVSIVREGPAYLFYVAPNTGTDRTATVRLVYTVPGRPGGTVDLVGPALGRVPLENVAWRVVLPPGYELGGYAGGLRLQPAAGAAESGGFTLQDYRSLVTTNQEVEAKNATSLLQQASSYLQKGNQQQAGEVLVRAYNSNGLDAASNEDARVQLRMLRTQQAVLGLNTRRQRIYLDNSGEVNVRNDQLDQAASLNPYLKGQQNFDPQQLDQLLMGNSAEENAALRGIAARLVDQQLAAEPAPGALDVTLPEHGRVLTFTRSLQVDGNAPLALQLEVGPARRTRAGYLLLVLLAVGVIAAVGYPRRAVRPAP